MLKVVATLGRVGNTLVISEPKTANSRRVVPLSPAVVTLLRKHRVAQKADRLRAGEQCWQETGLVFTTEFGTAVDPRSFLRVVQVAAQKAGVTGAGVHTLRHSVAVGWLGVRGAHQGRGRPAGALVHCHHRRRLRARQRRGGA